MGERHRHEVGTGVDEQGGAGDRLVDELAGEGEQETGRQRQGVPPAGGALPPEQAGGEQHEERRIEPGKAAVAAQFLAREPQHARDQNRRRSDRGHRATAAETPAERGEQDEHPEVPHQVVERPVGPVAGDEPPQLAGADPRAVVLEAAGDGRPERRDQRRQAEQERRYEAFRPPGPPPAPAPAGGGG